MPVKTRESVMPDERVDYAMLLNILHAERSEVLLREALCLLSPGGKLGIMDLPPYHYGMALKRPPLERA